MNCHENHIEKIKDPVCGMSITSNSAFRFKYLEKNYYFCSDKCQVKFSRSPKDFIHGSSSLKEVKNINIEYTCPMHPEVRQLGPGNCPKCGMALEPVIIDKDFVEDNSEYLDIKKRFILL